MNILAQASARHVPATISFSFLIFSILVKRGAMFFRFAAFHF